MSLLKVENLCVDLKKEHTRLVENVSFEIPDGECFGIVGQSGSGKSMICKSIMRLLNANVFSFSGSVFFRGDELLSMNAEALCQCRGKKLGMIAQNPMTAFAPSIKIGKQIRMTFSKKDKKDKITLDKEIKTAFHLVNLSNTEEILGSYPDELSGGMLQRIMIAIVLLQRPALLIADEITTALDSFSEQLVLEEMKKLKQLGISLLVITHDFSIAASLCEKIAVMKDGKFIECGNVQEILNAPKEEYTKELVSTSVLFEDKKCFQQIV